MFLPGQPRRRVVVTGMDAISCIGNTLDGITAALRAGTCGIAIDPERTTIGFRSPLTGVVQAVDPRPFFDRRTRKGMGEPALHAGIAALRAIAMSGCGDLVPTDRCGLLIGNDSAAEGMPAILDALRTHHDTTVLGSQRIIQSMNSTCTINLNPLLRIKGISLTISAACASGSHALGLGYLLIASGMQDLVLAGGAQETSWCGMAAFDALLTFSTRLDDPHGSCRPFDRDRDGLVPSGGAAMLVLEEYDQARARGAPILAEILGYAFGSDGSHVTTGDGAGAERCMRAALATAGVTPRDIGYINAHATATPAGDPAEAGAIHAVFGDDCPPVSSTKSLTGHECWMAGASEALYTILMLQHGFIAPNRNYEHPDPAMAPINVAARMLPAADLRIALSNSFGFGGTNACLVLGRAP